MVQVRDLRAMTRIVSFSEPCNRRNIFLGLIEYKPNNLLRASHLVDHTSGYNRFDVERYLLDVSGGSDLALQWRQNLGQYDQIRGKSGGGLLTQEAKTGEESQQIIKNM